MESQNTFATKLQKLSVMQEGKTMGEGKAYNPRQYERMADQFRLSWCVRVYVLIYLIH